MNNKNAQDRVQLVVFFHVEYIYWGQQWKTRECVLVLLQTKCKVFGLSIVSRGDWLWKSAIFKARNNRAASDVERTCHVIATVHTFKDGGCRRRLILVRRWFWVSSTNYGLSQPLQVSCYLFSTFTERNCGKMMKIMTMMMLLQLVTFALAAHSSLLKDGEEPPASKYWFTYSFFKNE